MDISFYNASDDTLIDIDYDVASESRASVNWSDLNENCTYYWYAVADDGYYQIQSDTWEFTTIEPYKIPDIDCSGTLIWTEVVPGEIVDGNVIVENVGEPDSLLDWKMESYPNWGTWVFDPENGTDLLEGDSVIIYVEVIAPDVQKETFTGEIIIVNIENPDDFCTIDVSLSTPTSQQFLYNIIFEWIFSKIPIFSWFIQLFQVK